MNSKPERDDSTSKSPTLSIDYRSGSVVMQLDSARWAGILPMCEADRSQISTSSAVLVLTRVPSERLLEPAA